MVMQGTIMRFDPDKGYGFVKPDDGGKDLFLHVSELRHLDERDIRPGTTRVSFQIMDSGRGPKAVRVFELPDALDEWGPAGNEGGWAQDQAPGEPEQPTVAAWRALWQRASDAAFESMLAAARGNGWVRD